MKLSGVHTSSPLFVRQSTLFFEISSAVRLETFIVLLFLA